MSKTHRQNDAKSTYKSNNKQINSLFGFSAPPKPRVESVKKPAPIKVTVEPAPKRRKISPRQIQLNELPYEMLEEIFKHLWLHEIAAVATVCRLFNRVGAEPRVRWSRIRVSSEKIRKINRAILKPDPPLCSYICCCCRQKLSALLPLYSFPRAANHIQQLDLHLSFQSVVLPTFKHEIKLVKTLTRLKALRISSDYDKYVYETLIEGIQSADFPLLEELQLRVPQDSGLFEYETGEGKKTPFFTFMEKIICNLRSLELPYPSRPERPAWKLLSQATRLECLKMVLDNGNISFGIDFPRMQHLDQLDLCFHGHSDWTPAVLALATNAPSERYRLSKFSISLNSRLESNDVWIPHELPTRSWLISHRATAASSVYNFLHYFDAEALTSLQIPGPKTMHVNDVLSTVLSCFVNLRNLKLDCWELAGLSDAAMSQLSRRTLLQSLVLESGSIASDAWQGIRLPNLEKLFLLRVTGVTPGFFASFDARFPKLHSLALAQTTVPNIGREVLPALKRHRGICRLNLDGTGLEAEYVSPFITSVGRRLKSFVLCPSGPPISDLDLDTFGHFCLDLENLSLCLDDAVLPQAVLTLRKRCKSLQRLEVLFYARLHQQSLELFKQANIEVVENL